MLVFTLLLEDSKCWYFLSFCTIMFDWFTLPCSKSHLEIKYQDLRLKQTKLLLCLILYRKQYMDFFMIHIKFILLITFDIWHLVIPWNNISVNAHKTHVHTSEAVNESLTWTLFCCDFKTCRLIDKYYR